MADRDIVANCRWCVGIGVDDRAVLDVAALPDADWSGIPPDDHAEPDARPAADFDIAGDDGCVGDERIVSDLRHDAAIGTEWIMHVSSRWGRKGERGKP